MKASAVPDTQSHYYSRASQMKGGIKGSRLKGYFVTVGKKITSLARELLVGGYPFCMALDDYHITFMHYLTGLRVDRRVTAYRGGQALGSIIVFASTWKSCEGQGQKRICCAVEH